MAKVATWIIIAINKLFFCLLENREYLLGTYFLKKAAKDVVFLPLWDAWKQMAKSGGS